MYIKNENNIRHTQSTTNIHLFSPLYALIMIYLCCEAIHYNVLHKANAHDIVYITQAHVSHILVIVYII